MQPNPTSATNEIQAYLALRDQALAHAEETMTEVALQRAMMANDFAINCLEPARAPYEAQCLPEVEAKRERQHCETVKIRIANLRMRVAAPRQQDLVAA